MPLPRISIVTPCLNSAGTIAEALESVLAQLRPGDEYIVLDGGSTDGTPDIIRDYADRLTSWTTGRDRGQSDAINTGFARATGDIFGWLNADDVLLPGALDLARQRLAGDTCDVVCGACRYEYPDGSTRVQGVTQRQLRQLATYDPIHQPSCFWRASLHQQVGGLDESLHYGMDWDLWLRLARAGARFAAVPDVLSVYRVTGLNKTSTGGSRRNREMYDILRRYAADDGRVLTELAYRVLWPLKRLRGAQPRWLCRAVSDLMRSTCLATLGPLFGFDLVRCAAHPFS